MTEPKEEFWTTCDGTRIAVGDMDEGHVRNALRMVLRNRRLRAGLLRAALDINPQDLLNDEHFRALADPHAYFPLLEGGVHGSPELQKKYGGR
jgi:hypothetical protein